MRPKWLVVLAVLLILFSWSAVFAGPKGEVGHGDDDIPELTKRRSSVSLQRLVDALEVESVWNAIFRVEPERQQELGRRMDARSVSKPATRRYPVKSK
ncbi:MAG: hypothetical protein PVJ42_08540 [bacterium]|jgi:hypothetical protein